MRWHRFTDGALSIAVQYGDPATVVLVGNIDANTRAVIIDVLETAMAWPGSPRIEVNAAGARLLDQRCEAEMLAIRDRALAAGRQFTIRYQPPGRVRVTPAS